MEKTELAFKIDYDGYDGLRNGDIISDGPPPIVMAMDMPTVMSVCQFTQKLHASIAAKNGDPTNHDHSSTAHAAA